MIADRVLESIALIFSGTGSLISLFTLMLIFFSIRPLTSNVPILLIINTYITVIGSSFMLFLIIIYAVYGRLHPSMSLDDYSCQLRAYFAHLFCCAFYYSCALQAIFRLFRVVFPKHKILQSRGVFSIAILIQWLVAILYILVYLLLGDFRYQPGISSCWLSFETIGALSAGLVFIYGISLIVMSVIYICIIRYLRQNIQIQRIRQQANKRDLLVVKRMIMLVLIAMGIGLPTGVMLIIHMITGYLNPLTYHIQALSLATGFILESAALGLITPQVREIFKKNRQQINLIFAIRNGTNASLPNGTMIN